MTDHKQKTGTAPVTAPAASDGDAALQTRIDSMNAQAWELRHSNLDRAIALSEQAANLAAQKNSGGQTYRRGQAASQHNLGRFNIRRGNYEQALAHFSKALAVFELLDDQKNIAVQLSYIGNVHARAGNFANGLDYLLKAQQLFERLDDQEMMAECFNDIGYTCVKLGQHQTALLYLGKSLRFFQQTGNKAKQIWALDSLCNAHLGLKDYPQALANGLQCVEICREIGDAMYEVEGLLSVGQVYLAQKQYSPALDHFQQALQIAQTSGYASLAADALRIIGDVHCAQTRPTAALPYLEQALQIAQETGTTEQLFACHKSLAQAYKQAGNFELALAHHEQFHLAKEVVFNDKADIRLKALEVRYRTETAEKEAEIHRLKRIELEKANASLLASNAELDAFAHTVAHDLKIPLGTITTAAHVFTESMSKLSPAEISQLAHIMARNAYNAANIVDELLLLSSVRKEKIHPAPVDMARIVARAQDRLAPMLEEYQGQIILPETWPTAIGYAPWIEEVWINYLSNGLKYGGEAPRLELGAALQPEAMIRFWVRDSGPGISPEAQASLFTEFTRLDTLHIKGHGLGLSIVRRIIEKLNGQVGVNSEVGRGSEFSFTLPAL